ncbi:cytochrome P450 [Phanerochaete sordida]|uniref:Cytochrome P450 n=1 Tax=Phanerochaete sordida TaxID=48140 RepID=A0A9P3G4D4_9APHY|nr:cytochrome P450 [Phanerochaete sordida]
MANLSKAQRLVLPQLLHLLLPAVLTSIALFGISRYSCNVASLSWSVRALAALFSVPVYHASRVHLKYRAHTHKAAALGAVLPPLWQGSSVGNWDIMQRVGDAFENGFLSDEFFEAFTNIGPTYNFYAMWGHNFCTIDAAAIKSILVLDFEKWNKGEQFDSYVHSLLGFGVFNADGELWRHHRSMTRPFFSRQRITDFELLGRHSDAIVDKIKERTREGFPVDLQDLFARLTMDCSSELFLGSCMNTIHCTLPYPHYAPQELRMRPRDSSEEFMSAFQAAQIAVCNRTRLTWIWPWFEFFKDKTAGSMKTVHAYMEPIIQNAVRSSTKMATTDAAATGCNDVGEDESLLDYLVKHTKDPVVIRDEMLNIMVAGRDTTGATLSIAMYFLSQYADVLRRLRAEVMDIVGPTAYPTYEHIRRMKYLRAVLNETMRLYPAVPWNLRFPTQDIVLPNSEVNAKPWFIPAGSSMSFSVHCMHRRTDYWGPDAEEFDPDRFLDERLQKYPLKNPFIFLPFNAGPRICLGQQFAYNKMSFVVIRLLQNFDGFFLQQDAVEPALLPRPEWAGLPGRKGKEQFWPKSHLTTYSAGGLWMTVSEEQRGGI